ncbi:MAG: hypothetical protein GY866_20185 [Proteobacteria bacterium]|nr:hypothetical protein [Pseudomonadota bacterium]
MTATSRKKKLYIDVCTFCRPFDDQQMMRIRLETDAYHLIMSNARKKYHVMISPVHDAEIAAISDSWERIKIESLFARFRKELQINHGKQRNRADYLYSLGFGIADAAHVAYAEAIADVFITCDDKPIKKCRKEQMEIPVVNPVEFTILENLK